jgi:CheY-like chemotaxis protein
LKKILIIDDNSDFREIYSFALGDDYEVHTLASRDEAESLLKTGYRPDLILMDLQMQGSSAAVFLEFCKSLPELREARIVAVSSYSERDIQDLNLEIPFFQKPSTMKELLRIVSLSLE